MTSLPAGDRGVGADDGQLAGCRAGPRLLHPATRSAAGRAVAAGGAGLVGAVAVVAVLVAVTGAVGRAGPAPVPDGAAVTPAGVAPIIAAGGATGAGSVLPQVRGSAADPHFAVWCGSARGVPALQPAVGYVIRWGDPVSAEDLPRAAYGLDVGPDIQGYSEYGDYVIPGATGQEEWAEAVIYCLDQDGTPIANLPAVLDRAAFGS